MLKGFNDRRALRLSSDNFLGTFTNAHELTTVVSNYPAARVSSYGRMRVESFDDAKKRPFSSILTTILQPPTEVYTVNRADIHDSPSSQTLHTF